jgi:hypothetical protein
MNIAFILTGVIAAAILGALADWILTSLLPDNPKVPHIIAGILAFIILALAAAWPSIESENQKSSTSSTSSVQTLTTEVARPIPIPTATIVPGPTATPNAFDVRPEDLTGDDREIVQSDIVNLDGMGPHEIVMRWHNTDYTNKYEDKSLDVFAFEPSAGWQPVLRLSELQNAGCLNLPDFGIINLLNDDTRQLAVWTQCGSGSYVTLELYKFEGLSSMWRIWSSHTDGADIDWLESVPQVRNEKLFVVHQDGLYQYIWDNGNLRRIEIPIDPGSSGITVEFWFDGERVQVSQPNVILEVGQVLYLKYAQEKGAIPWPVRIQYGGNGSLEVSDDYILFKAKKPGTTDISLWGRTESDPLVIVTVVAP